MPWETEHVETIHGGSPAASMKLAGRFLQHHVEPVEPYLGSLQPTHGCFSGVRTSKVCSIEISYTLF